MTKSELIERIVTEGKMGKRARVMGSRMRPLELPRKLKVAAELKERVWPVLGTRIRPLIDSEFTLERAGDAHRRSASSRSGIVRDNGRVAPISYSSESVSSGLFAEKAAYSALTMLSSISAPLNPFDAATRCARSSLAGSCFRLRR